MERMEELSARLRCLSQDHERLIGLHKVAKEQIAQAQRDCELTKSKHACVRTAHHQVITNATLTTAQQHRHW